MKMDTLWILGLYMKKFFIKSGCICTFRPLKCYCEWLLKIVFLKIFHDRLSWERKVKTIKYWEHHFYIADIGGQTFKVKK